MPSRFSVGDLVQTRFGKGVVREIRNGELLVVAVQDRALVLAEHEISARGQSRKRSGSHRGTGRTPDPEAPSTQMQVDLHGLNVEEALERIDKALNDALLANVSELRFIHGRSGGRLREALQRRLAEIPNIRNFRLDAHNEGVTIVNL